MVQSRDTKLILSSSNSILFLSNFNFRIPKMSATCKGVDVIVSEALAKERSLSETHYSVSGSLFRHALRVTAGCEARKKKVPKRSSGKTRLRNP